jgi:uncharacterized protein (DUF2384 family)
MIRRPESPAVQEKLGQIAHIITHAAQLAGGDARAIIWFRHQPLSGWNRTAEELVEEGLAREVLDDLDRHAEGVYS